MSISTLSLRRSLAALCCVLLLGAVSPPALCQVPDKDMSSGPADSLRVPVVVVGFKDASRRAAQLLPVLEGNIGEQISHSPFLNLVDRSSLPVILQEIEYDERGLTDEAQRKELGKLKSVSYIITGQINGIQHKREYDRETRTTSIQATVDMMIVAIRAETAEIEFQKRITEDGWIEGKDNEAASRSAIAKAASVAVKELAAKVAKSGTLSARIIDIDRVRQFLRIDKGRQHGIASGVDFSIYEVNEIKTSSGKVITEENLVCYAKSTDIGEDWSKLITGEYKKELFRGTRFKPNPKLMEKVKENFIVRPKGSEAAGNTKQEDLLKVPAGIKMPAGIKVR